MKVALRIMVYLFLACLAMALLGCQSDATEDAQSSEGVTAEITEPMTGASLHLDVDSSEIDLADRVRAMVSIRWAPGTEVELIEPDWDTGGWHNTRSIRGEIGFDGESYQQEILFELDPFLSGEYEIPSIGIRATSDTTGRRIVRLAPVGIEVRSVLEEGDGDELDPASGLARLDTEKDHLRTWNIIGGLVLGLAGIGVLIWTVLQNTKTPETRIDPESVLMVAASSPDLSDEDLGTLHRAMIELSKDHSEIGVLTQDLELARFSGHAVDHQRVRNTAQRALELCGTGGRA